ncbi:hypothetical protein BH11PLA2_BH11PLA2_03030 [soil metagenome]
MFEAFVNPWSMIAGALLVSVPIIIHLINRLRYKKIHWAAMEFLLKAQKRMKRKLIIQQLLLLFLRCLMVFLLGMLVGRFLGFNPFKGNETRSTVHTVILDDTPSMADAGDNSDAYAAAKKLVGEQITASAMQASNPQLMDVIKLSDLSKVDFYDRLNNVSVDKIKSEFTNQTPSAVRGNLADALKKAKELADKDTQGTARIVHVVSDFRSGDWEQDGPALRQAIDALIKQNVKVHLIDVASPARKDDKRPPLFHDNIGITDLIPSKSVVAAFEPSEFTLRVRNFGVAEVKDVKVAVSVNGDDNEAQSISIPTIAGGQTEEVRFKIVLKRTGTAEKPLERFSLVSARYIPAADTDSLKADNVRHTVVEVRARLPILAIDGRPGDREKKEGDSFYLRNLFTNVNGGYTWVPGTARDLETQDLRQYSCIYLLNVPSFNETAVKNLEQYVKDGGGVGIFLGPDVKPTDYNNLLYADGKGILPVPLPDKAGDPLPEEKVFEKLFNFQKKILLRDKAASRLEPLYNIYFNERGKEDKENSQGLEKFFNFVLVKQYWPIKRTGKWRDDPSVKELYCLPNEGEMGKYEPAAVALLGKIPVDEPKYAKYKDVLSAGKLELRKVASSTEPLFKLATTLDRFLSDQISEGDPSEALLREFWAMPENAELKTETTRLREAVKYGDPLYLSKTFGRGRVTLVTTTAGELWNDWPAGPGGRSYPPIMTEMERYLSGGGTDDSPSVGSAFTKTFDATQYKPGVSRTFITADYSKDPSKYGAIPVEVKDLKEQPMVSEKGVSTFNFTDSGKPGAYLFTFTRLKAASGTDAAEVPEYAAVAFNVDAAREGDLRRAAKDDILQQAPGAALHSTGDLAWLDELKNKRTDLTEAGWIFLFLLLILLAEQWLSVKLSHHSHGKHAEDFAPSVGATLSRSTVPTSTAKEPTTAA